jgi:hypothetical protein
LSSFVLTLHSFCSSDNRIFNRNLKIRIKKVCQKYSQVRSCFEVFIVRNPMVQSKFNFDVWFVIYRFLVSINVACGWCHHLLFSFACMHSNPTSCPFLQRWVDFMPFKCIRAPKKQRPPTLGEGRDPWNLECAFQDTPTFRDPGCYQGGRCGRS